MPSWSLTLLLLGISILFLARDSYQRFFASLLMVTAALGLALGQLELSPSSRCIWFLMYIILHLLAIGLSPLQILFTWSKPRPKFKTGITIHHPQSKQDVGDISVDVVAVHGLGSDPDKAWLHEASKVMWLKTLLPKTLPRARIMAFNHNSAWTTDAPVKSIEVCGQQLLDALNTYRNLPEEKDRPIIFIGHSFGGIIIKKALVTAGQENIDPRYQSLKKATIGLVFLGVPHDGSRLTSIGMVLSYSTYWLGSSTELLEALKPGARSLRELNDSFLKGYSGRHIVNFYETLKSRVFGIPLLLGVERDASIFPGTISIALDSNHIEMNKFSNAEDLDYKLLAKEICRMEESVYQEQLKVTSLDQQECLDSLYLCGSEERKGAIEKPHKSTFQWVDNNPVIRSWMEHESQVIWISGKPGSGKSTLAKHLIDSVVTQNIGHQLRKQGTAVTASFFFNGRGSEIERSERGFLQSLLHQFVTQIPELTSLVPKQKRDNTGKTVPTSLEQLRKSLLSILGDSRVKSTRLVIDAVDECEEDCKETIVYFITEDLVKHPSIPQVLVTSRLDLDLQDPFGAYPTIKMEDLNSDDIKTYLGAEFGSLASRDPRPELIVGIVERAILRSQGVFLWVKLVVKELKKTARSGTARELGKALDALPGNLIEFYDRILKGLDMSSSSNESQRMLEWVVFAETPLSVADLRYAVFIGSELRPSDLGSMEDPETTVPMELMEARIHEYSGGLLEVKIQVRESDRTEQIGYWDTEYSGRDEDRFVQLIHQSVKDFLLQKRSPRPISAAQPLLLFDPHKAHTHLARVCLRFLGFPEFDTASRLPTLPFLKYSTTYWVTHAELADIRQEEAQMLEFGWPRRKNFSAWATSPMMNDWVNITRWRSDPLSLASAVGLWADARYFLALLNQELDTWEKNNTLSVALVAAASGGHERIVQLLLDSGADANCRALFSESALQEAASRGYETIVQILLDAGANVLYADRSGDALTAAADGGNEKIVQLLLDAGADANAQGGEYGTALQAAAYRGNEKIVHLLLGAGADVHAQSGEYETALHEAAHNGNEKVVKILLDAGADVDIQDRQYGTALQAAAYTDKVGVLQLLLDAGADVNSQAGGGPATALHIAIAAGNKNVVQFLINAGADIDTIDVQSGTALQVAAYWDNPGILQLLLDAGANIDAEGGEHGTALQAAAYTGNENIVQLLLDKGANVNSQGGSYESPLKAAAYSGNEKVLQLLLDTGADPNSQDRECRTALHVAACGEREKVVQVLLDAGADANAQDRQYGTALQAAAHHGNEKIVQLLLGAGADVNAGVGQYGTALQLAVRYGNERVIQILLEAGADPNAQDWGWGTALEIAIDTGLVNSVQQLLDSGADVGTRSRETVSQETRDIHEPFSGADSGM